MSGPMKDALNKSRRDRLNKAAKQGYGPWSQRTLTKAAPSEGVAFSFDSSSGQPSGTSSFASSSSRPAEAEPELDKNGFLAARASVKVRKAVPLVTASSVASIAASRVAATTAGVSRSAEVRPAPTAAVEEKPKPTPPPPASGPPKLTVKLAPGTNPRSIAAQQGARPKVSSSKGSDDSKSDDDEQATAKSEKQESAKQLDDQRDFEHSSDEDLDPEVRRKRIEKRKREEWRRQWKEKHPRTKSPDEARGTGKGKDSSDDDLELVDAKHRANMWAALNNNGVKNAKDVQKKMIGQVSDTALDRRLKEVEEASRGQKLMSEAEILAKMRKGKNDKGR